MSTVKRVLMFMLQLVTLFSYYWLSQSAESNPCTGKRTCGECIVVSPLCGWCVKEFPGNKYRCDLIKNLLDGGCNTSDIQNPDNQFHYIKNIHVRDAIRRGGKHVQLAPQEINIAIRPNKPAKFNVTFRLARNYPVDVYFLMDLSKTMEIHRTNTAKLGHDLAKKLLNLTSDARFGFGTFVDKVALPFTSTHPDKLLAPCRTCASPYAFKHHLSLNEDIEQFTQTVASANTSGNLDAPEGGLEAMMQVVVCRNQIGWRKQARRLLVYCSDATFHSAGDGRMAGIVLPNDGDCHLDSSGSYLAGLKQDYPSVSHTAQKIHEGKINVIFAVVPAKVMLYKLLSKWIEGSAVGTLSKESASILNLVTSNYEKISSRIELGTESDDEDIYVSFRSECLGNTTEERKHCDGLKIGEEVTFEVTIQVVGCSGDPLLRQRSLVIYPVGLNEKLKINLDIMCDCECEDGGNSEPSSPMCNGNGTLACGVCICNPGRGGKQCECDKTAGTVDFAETGSCKAPNSSLTCSAQGNCKCGECICWKRSPDSDERFSGAFCQCDDYSCDYYQKEVCGGSARGRCNCGSCLCNPDFDGPACGCDTRQKACMSPGSELPCSGKGECVCGKCQCPREKGCFGTYCEKCPTCIGKCHCNRDCVECRVFGSGKHKPEGCQGVCSGLDIETVEILFENSTAVVCSEMFNDGTECTYRFAHEMDSDNNLKITAQTMKVCPIPVDPLPIILGVAAGVLFIGLALLLIWKIITTIYDKVEYQKFAEEAKNPQWEKGENPLFKQATTTFANPMCENTLQ